MFLLQPILECVHFLKTAVFYIWSISLHLGRGTFLFLQKIFIIVQDIFKAIIILSEELFRFFTELNAAIDVTATYIGNSANNGIDSVINAILIFFKSFSNFFTKSEIRTRLLATNLGLAVKSFCALLYGALLLIADTCWWLLTLIPRTIIKLIVAAADWIIFSFCAAVKYFLYIVQTLLNDIFRITTSLFIIFLLWKQRRHIQVLLSRCYAKTKTFLRLGMRFLLTRWRNHSRPRIENFARPPSTHLALSHRRRSTLNESKVTELQMCVICRDAPKSVLLWPCRHLCLCEECADRMETSQQATITCPLCRSHVESFVTIYT